jgi:hypothetical protein
LNSRRSLVFRMCELRCVSGLTKLPCCNAAVTGAIQQSAYDGDEEF